MITIVAVQISIVEWYHEHCVDRRSQAYQGCELSFHGNDLNNDDTPGFTTSGQ